MKHHAAILTLAALLAAPASGASAGSWIKTGSETSRPYGHHAFCKSHPGECATQRESDAERLSKKRWRTMVSVNAAVNKAIKPVSDQAKYGRREVWKANVSSGDCEDYALTKRKRLVRAGFKRSNLRLAMVSRPNGEAHVVLVVRTDKGDYMLDNLNSKVRLWNRSGYRFVKIQDGRNASAWVKVRG